MRTKYTNTWDKEKKKYVPTHTYLAEKALGKPLPLYAEVHHIDGNGRNNHPSNLVICPNGDYHRLLHKRQEALAACGDVNKRKCSVCKQWDSTGNLFLAKKRTHREGQYWHRLCMNKQRKERYWRKKNVHVS